MSYRLWVFWINLAIVVSGCDLRVRLANHHPEPGKGELETPAGLPEKVKEPAVVGIECAPRSYWIVSATCERLAGCGSTANCDSIEQPEVTPNCVPRTCASVPSTCGRLTDGCGGTLNCGGCSGYEVCGGAGVANVCGPFCTGNWCWESEHLQGNHLRGLATLDADHTWAVGSAGVILFWDGNAWSRQISGTASDLMAVWAANAQDVWAVGNDDTVAHFDGKAWTATSIPGAGYFRAIQGSAPDDVWAMGRRSIYHWNGSTWSVAYDSCEDLEDLWISPEGDIFVASRGGKVIRGRAVSCNGGFSWVDTNAGAFGVWGFDGISSSDIWAVGSASVDGPVVKHFNGSVWSDVSWNWPAGTWVFDVRALATDNVWITTNRGVSRWNGTALEHLPVPSEFGKHAGSALYDGVVSGNAIKGDSESNLWMLSDSAMLSRWNGTRWEYSNGVPTPELFSISTPSRVSAWAVGRHGHIGKFNGSTWSTVAPPPLPSVMPSDWWSPERELYSQSLWDVWAGVAERA